MVVTAAAVPLLLAALYLILLALTVGRVADSIQAARGGSEYLGRRLWLAVAFLTFPSSLALYGVARLAVLVAVPTRWVTRLLSWGGWLLLTALIAFWTYQVVNGLAPSAVGRDVLIAYIVSLPLLFAAADLAARRLGQKEADSRTWLRGVMAVTWVFGLATLGYLEVFHRRQILRRAWIDALAVAGAFLIVVGGIYVAIAFSGPAAHITRLPAHLPTAASAPPTANP